jgi:hypothetical protein
MTEDFESRLRALFHSRAAEPRSTTHPVTWEVDVLTALEDTDTFAVFKDKLNKTYTRVRLLFALCERNYEDLTKYSMYWYQTYRESPFENAVVCPHGLLDKAWVLSLLLSEQSYVTPGAFCVRHIRDLYGEDVLKLIMINMIKMNPARYKRAVTITDLDPTWPACSDDVSSEKTMIDTYYSVSCAFDLLPASWRPTLFAQMCAEYM